ncbi:MAG: monofunctional biosynthetic peptidoglycan transglycosylase [Rhizobiaceae bacterium]
MAQAKKKATAMPARKKPTKPKKKSIGKKPAKPRRVKLRVDPKAFGNPRLKRFVAKIFKWTFVAILLLCMAPILLTILYIPSSVHPISTLMVSKWYQGEKVQRKWVRFEDISPFVYQSVISSEDGKFCFHRGVDWDAVNLVVDDLLEGEKPRGASTIPMQTVKNIYLWSSRSYIRKILEVPLALYVDFVWGKRRMMEIYLNIAEWGPGIYGIEAASRAYFKRSAKHLSRKQAALLAVALPNPKLRNPKRPKRGMRRLARLVEGRAKASGAYVKCLK